MAFSTIDLSIVILPSLIDVSSPSSTSVILICCFFKVRITFFSPTGADGTAAGSSSATAGTAGATAAPGKRGISSLNPSRLEALSISMCNICSPPLLCIILAGPSVITGFVSVTSGSAAVSAVSLILSSTSLVIGVRASTSQRSLEPNTCSIFNPSSDRVRRPASSMSSKSDGSSKSAAEITRPFSLRQQNIAGSLRCAFNVSAVIDIRFPPLSFKFSYKLIVYCS